MTEREMERFVLNIDWAVTTADDCLGQPPGSSEGFAVYDASEDDPPIAVCTFREDAEAIVWALRKAQKAARRRGRAAETFAVFFRTHPAYAPRRPATGQETDAA